MSASAVKGLGGKEITLDILVTLTGKEISTLCGDEQAITERLSGIATGLLQDQAGGGMMVQPDAMQRIEDATGAPIDSQDELVLAVEKGVSRREGGLEIRWRIDPQWEPQIRERAEICGRTVDELMFEMMAVAMNNGWLYEIQPGPQPLIFDPEDLEYLKETVGERLLTGTDITKFVRGLVESPVSG